MGIELTLTLNCAGRECITPSSQRTGVANGVPPDPTEWWYSFTPLGTVEILCSLCFSKGMRSQIETRCKAHIGKRIFVHEFDVGPWDGIVVGGSASGG